MNKGLNPPIELFITAVFNRFRWKQNYVAFNQIAFYRYWLKRFVLANFDLACVLDCTISTNGETGMIFIRLIDHFYN